MLTKISAPKGAWHDQGSIHVTLKYIEKKDMPEALLRRCARSKVCTTNSTGTFLLHNDIEETQCHLMLFKYIQTKTSFGISLHE